MTRQPDYVRKKYGPLLSKTLQNAVSHCLHRQFPRIGGPRIRALCATMILEVLARHVRPQDHVQHGQVLWMAVSVEDPPRIRQPFEQAELVPVVLDLSTPEDIEARIDRRTARQRLCRRAVRLCRQAYEQGGLLSNCDLAELLGSPDSNISSVLSHYERQHGEVVPRRATIHDVGTAMTHKRIICRKRYAEGKPPEQIAKETHHSLEAVDRYLGQYDRVRHCRIEGLTAAKTAHMLNCGVRLVEAYLAIDEELEARKD